MKQVMAMTLIMSRDREDPTKWCREGDGGDPRARVVQMWQSCSERGASAHICRQPLGVHISAGSLTLDFLPLHQHPPRLASVRQRAS